MKTGTIVIVILAAIFGVSFFLLKEEYGKGDSTTSAIGTGEEVEAVVISEKPEETEVEVSEERIPEATAEPDPTPTRGATETEDPEDEKKKRRGPQIGEDDSIFPTLAEREPFDIPEDFGRDHRHWSAAYESAIRMSQLDPERFDTEVGYVNGTPVLFREVLEEAVMRFGEKFVEQYKNELILIAEISGNEVEVTEEELAIGEKTMWDLLGKKGIRNAEQLEAKFKWTEEMLRFKAYLEEGGKKIFAKDMGVEDPSETEVFFQNVWMSEVVNRYETRSRYGQSEGLEEGVLAQVGDRVIRAIDVAPFLVPSLKPFHFEMAFDSLVEAILVKQELAKMGVFVTEAEIDERIERERRKYANSLFNYETMLGLGETNVVMERRKFRGWLALSKKLGEPSDEELREHFKRNPVFFCRGAVAACEIKTTVTDPDTGMSKGDDAWEQAEAKILEAKSELDNGAPFQQLVARFSEDPNTKKIENATLFGGEHKRVGGSIGIFPIKEGRMANEIAAAAFLAAKDQWIGPVKGRDGYHLLYLLDTKPPRDLPFDDEEFTDMNGNGKFELGEPFFDGNDSGNWNKGQRDNVRDDFEDERLGRWMSDLVSRARVERMEEEFSFK